MTSAREFRELALDCLRRAQQTDDDRERLILLETAARWMRAAVAPSDGSDPDNPSDQKNHKT